MNDDRVVTLAAVTIAVAVIVYLIVSAYQAHKISTDLLDEARLAMTRMGMQSE